MVSANSTERRSILVTGATGYVGGRLLKALERGGERVTVLARRPDYLRAFAAPTTEIVEGDVLDSVSLRRALQGVDVAYYLVHSMGAVEDFEELDRKAAKNFARVARGAGVRRIIYLGGLGDERDELSPHLRSRHEVGRILRCGGVQVLEFRASIIIGSGSFSFEMIRSLTENLPVMVMPLWVIVLAQPIGIEDVIDYLTAALDLETEESEVIEIGGRDRVSYRDIMREYARQRGLRRFFIPVPVLTPWLSSLWLGLVTPVYARVGRKLVASIHHATMVEDERALQLFPLRPMGLRKMIKRALCNEEREFAQTRWFDAVSSASTAPLPRFGGMKVQNRYVDVQETWVDVKLDKAFVPIAQLGGKNGWYGWDLAWKLLGTLDLLMGGVGMRRGRPENRELRPGDPLDFWRVEVVDPPRRLVLAAEVWLPGRAWLEFNLLPKEGGTIIRQLAMFEPSGLQGLAYWYGNYPIHGLVFRKLLRDIAERAARD
jgi:uncharacterized protein YbjT (DUF2867 family)